MNILFLTMSKFTGMGMHNIYSDLLEEFIRNGHRPYIVTPREKQDGEATACLDCGSYSLLKICIGNTSGVSFIEKGISTVTLSVKYYRAVRKHFGKIEFDLIIYSTPPITLANPVRKFQKMFFCPTYLMLKDIFPQNAADLEMFSESSLIYRYFRRQEQLLYAVADHIGCMSPANIEYVLAHNPEIERAKVGYCPNAIRPHEAERKDTTDKKVLEKYGIPQNKIVFLYGGNLGKPQGIPFMIDCFRAEKDNCRAYFLIIGSGSEYSLIQNFIDTEHPENVRLIPLLPKGEYDAITVACDVGLIFLDYRFTIPNFPSRLLSYMEAGLPVLACTDPHTDIGKVITEGGFGLWCESNDRAAFSKCVAQLCDTERNKMSMKSTDYLKRCYAVDIVYKEIMKAKNGRNT